MRLRSWLALMVCAALLLAATPLLAQENDSAYPVDTITVIGSATASGSPDVAYIEIGVEVINPDVTGAFGQVNERIEAIINAIVETGVAREDIQTTGINVFSQIGPGGPGAGDQQYSVSNRVRVTVRQIDQVDAVIDAAVNAGANNIYGLTFDIADRSGLEGEARQAALDDARERAEQYATLLGVTLGDVVIINEGAGGFPPQPFLDAAMGRGGGGGAVVEPGQLSVGLSVQVTFRINR